LSVTTHLKPTLPTRPETTFRQLTLNALQFRFSSHIRHSGVDTDLAFCPTLPSCPARGRRLCDELFKPRVGSTGAWSGQKSVPVPVGPVWAASTISWTHYPTSRICMSDRACSTGRQLLS